MANISFNDMDFSENNNFENSVGFFNLKEDGEEAVVRFVLDSVDDMEIYSVHTVKDGGKFKKFNCLRSPKEPTSKCPFCEKDAQVNKTDKSFAPSQKIYIKMLQYEPNGDGTYTPHAKIWERSAYVYAPKLKNYIDTYGDLSNIVCKVVRNGRAGDMKTTYEIMPGINPSKFNEQTCPIDTSAFDNFKVMGTMIPDTTADDMYKYLGMNASRTDESDFKDFQEAQRQYQETPQQNRPADAPIRRY